MAEPTRRTLSELRVEQCYLFMPAPPAPNSATPVNINYVFGMNDKAAQNLHASACLVGDADADAGAANSAVFADALGVKALVSRALGRRGTQSSSINRVLTNFCTACANLYMQAGETVNVSPRQRRRSNRPGNSQAKGPLAAQTHVNLACVWKKLWKIARLTTRVPTG